MTGATIGVIEDTTDFARMDTCLAHENSDGRYHYHFPSPCVADGTVSQALKNSDRTLANNEADLLQQQKDIYKKLPYRSVFGLAKDGRPIYTPYHGNLKTYGECEVDVCNGLTIDGQYSYVTTLYYPYYIACYGSGAVVPKDTWSCFPTANARTCDSDGKPVKKDEGATELKTIGALSVLLASIYMI